MKKIYLAFLWHQHQPMYKNPSTGIYELPWVRLHATKDYYDTVAILDEFPDIKSNFNLVPSLLAQLDDYARGNARDKFLDLTLKPAQDLTADERVFVLLNFFMANWETMVYPYPRYLQLLEKRGKQTSATELRRIQAYFKASDIRDLQVWFNLSWMDPYWQERDELVKELIHKGRDFTEEDKQALIKKQLEICGIIVDKYRELQDKGQIEVTTTPFYHPILPLLNDTNTARSCMPQVTLPRRRFQHPEDARMQVQKATGYYQRLFGRPPSGMWPAEGSVSEEVIPIFAEAGISWIATDEEILFRSKPGAGLHRAQLYQPYRLSINNHTLNIIFRDHALSDAIGFVYTRWKAADAVNDFMKRLYAIRDSAAGSENPCFIPVILDGENCWEYYANDGWDFLRLLYRTLSNDPSIETVTINKYLKEHPPVETLPGLWPGSWINGNYGIWLGHAEDNLAWDYLGETRNFLTDYVKRNPDKQNSPAVTMAWERIYIAEGSDWNWWYGEDHSSDNDPIFDYLFRQNLISVYELLGEKVPDHLFKAIKGFARVKEPTLQPIDYISPVIDGEVTNYFEWKPAGFYQVGHAGGSMHQVETVIKSFHYGFDLRKIYFRLDLNIPLTSPQISELGFKIILLKPEGHEARMAFNPDGTTRECVLKTPNGEETLEVAAGKVIEFAIPVDKLLLPNEMTTIEFVVTGLKNGLEIERWPYQSSVTMPKPSDNFALETWSV